MAKSNKSASEKKVQHLSKNQGKMNDNPWAQLVARAWSDEAFKNRLLTQPAAVLKEAGLEVPEGLQLKVVENTERLCHLILPPPPAAGELSEETLAAVAAGKYNCASMLSGSIPCQIPETVAAELALQQKNVGHGFGPTAGGG